MGEESVSGNDDFKARQEAAKAQINALDHERLFAEPRRDAFFDTVYQNAKGDAAFVPWADLAPKHALADWLMDNPGQGKRAIDVGCGLGDNAEALAAVGYKTIAFDFSADAIRWAKERFPETSVDYRTADLFGLPEEFLGAFDVVHECYTLQSIPPETLSQSVPAVASLVAPGGKLLVYTRLRADGAEVQGPPWPLEEKIVSSFSDYGLDALNRERFELEKGERKLLHEFAVWRRPA